ncbi:ATP-binding protein [Streptomyces antimicrobicus]|uniref:ATP-binding protein n=1 Tax=Streptomyces antimicrobicus TaxID=2883108 RepID=A0ABS8B4Z9_9ACTN|nr:ATP-binding protein [Streptomyces antimicrobicus]MCB5179698.1 ATP-binding protein [Streptomyces antimicrobicus]
MTTPSSSGPDALACVFTQRLSSTPRGARLARHLTLLQLEDWGIPYRTDLSDRAAQLVAELAANAVTHGRVPGRDLELRVSLLSGVVRIELADARRDRRPHPTPDGHGLPLIEALADAWGVTDRAMGKTVWVEATAWDQRNWASSSKARSTSGSEAEGSWATTSSIPRSA